MTDIGPFLEAAVRTATPLLVASVGELVSERAGVINVGLEGCIIAGAYTAFATAQTSLAGAYMASSVAGMALGALLVLFSVVLRRDQIIVGTALTLLGLGVTGTLFRVQSQATALIGHTEHVVRIPLLADIPVLGAVLFAQPPITYFAFALVPVVLWWLQRTHSGLALRAVGESPDASRAAGIPVMLMQGGAVMFGAAMGGVAGASLVLAQAGSFAEGMSAGRGFLAIAIVALGRWRPLGVFVASLVFGTAMAVEFVVQALGWHVRYELVLMIPYVLTLAALGAFGRGSAPAMLGRTAAEF